MRFLLESLRAAAEIVYRQVPATPQYVWPLLSGHAGLTVWVKHENHTQTGAFKVRGGSALHAPPQAASAGLSRRDCGDPGQPWPVDRGQRDPPGAAFGDLRTGGQHPEKNAAMIAQGAELVIHGRDFQESLEHARRLAAAEGLHMVAAFDPTLVMGVASYALELFAAAGPL